MADFSLNNVRAYARELHGQQKRRGGVLYFQHLLEVEELCGQIYNSGEVELKGVYDLKNILATALLHDLIEDTRADYEDIERIANRTVTSWVAQLSEDKRKPKAVRKEENRLLLSKACSAVQVIKLSDVFSNVDGIKFTEDSDWIEGYLDYASAVLNILNKIQHLSNLSDCRELISECRIRLNKG